MFNRKPATIQLMLKWALMMSTVIAIAFGSFSVCAEMASHSVTRVFSDDSSIQPVDYSKLIIPNDAEPTAHEDSTDEQDDIERTDRRLRVAFVGNTLIHRCGEFASLELELTRLMPNRATRFRNLGWPGDTVSGDARIGFGRGEENLGTWRRPGGETSGYGLVKLLRDIRRERPHVLMIAYGSNVAFEQQSGLERFRQGLDKLLDALLPTGVRVVLISPPPRESSVTPAANLETQNKWLAKVAAHHNHVAQQRKVGHVDLFHQWPASIESFTDNGIHLNELGYRVLARIVADAITGRDGSDWELQVEAADRSVRVKGASVDHMKATQYGMRWHVHDECLPSPVTAFSDDGGTERRLTIRALTPGNYILDIDGQRVARGTAAEWALGVTISKGPDFERVEELRQKILQKNRLFFYGFRPQNKAYIHLFRRYERGHHAAEIERFRTLVRAAEDDIGRLARPSRRIYELVRETDYPEHEVPEAAPEANLDEELAAFQLPEGFQINLFASDPMISKPININWDERGRMWVATSTVYPHLQPGQSPDDRILILEDVDRDGVADKSTVFADKLLVPHSVIPGHGGVFVTQSTDLLFLRDTNGDDVADERRVLLTGFGNADVHHMIHGLRWGPGGDLYFTQSIYINSVVETPWGVRSSFGACIWRFRPDTLQLERFSQGLTNPWGLSFDPWGQAFASDGAGGKGMGYMFPGSAYRTHPYAGRELNTFHDRRPKECGLEYLSGRHLPADWLGTFLTADFRVNRITRYRLSERGSSYSSEFLGDMIRSTNRAFRPVDLKMGPDGAIYIVDWYNLIVDHGEVDFHHPLRDKRHGRIWRLTYPNQPLVSPPDFKNADTEDLLAALRAPEDWTRDQARRLLREKSSTDVLSSLRSWVAEPKIKDKDRLEALWVCQGLRHVEPSLLQKCLQSEDHHIRAAAVRVLSDWAGKIPDAMQHFETAVGDQHPQVRLEAVSGLRRVGSLDAVAVAVQALNHPVDTTLDFALFRTVHELRDVWLPEFESGRFQFGGNARHIAFAFSAVAGEASLNPLIDLLKTQKLSADEVGEILVVLAASGDAKQRAIVLDRLPNLAINDAKRIAAALLRSDRNRIPTNSNTVERFLDSDDAEYRQLAIQLVGRWRVESAFETLAARLADKSLSEAERVWIGEATLQVDAERAGTILRATFESAPSPSIAATVAASMAIESPIDAASMTVKLLGQSIAPSLIDVMVDGLLRQKDGPEALAIALSGKQLQNSVAQYVLDRIRLSGQNLTELAQAIRAAGNLKPLAALTAAEIGSILRDVSKRGNAQRGTKIFHRRQLQCTTCHRVNGEGGEVGPDLSSLGGSARVADILMSLLEPSATIKQGYQTAQIITVDGKIISGILQQRTQQNVSVRDAMNRLHTISNDDIDEVEGSRVSMMPSGLLETLTRDELIDLVAYLSTLGRVQPQPK